MVALPRRYNDTGAAHIVAVNQRLSVAFRAWLELDSRVERLLSLLLLQAWNKGKDGQELKNCYIPHLRWN